MSQTPIIIPLIVAGIFLGSMWQNKTLAGVWRKMLLFAATAGLLNGAYAFLLGYSRISAASSSTNDQLATVASSGLAGFLIVITIFVSAAIVIRHRRGEEVEPQQ